MYKYIETFPTLRRRGAVQADTSDDGVVAALGALDERVFPHKSDLFTKELWGALRNVFDYYWIREGEEIVGSIWLGQHLEWRYTDLPAKRPGCLYAAHLGIAPEHRRRGIATRAKRWQIDFARAREFNTIATNCRKSNVAMIELNQKFGFEIIDEIDDFWGEPFEPAVILELKL